MIWFMIVAIFAASVSADKLHIELLKDVTLPPTKIAYESYWPLSFEVTAQHINDNETCQGVEDAQFGIITVYGRNNGINIIPSWKKDTSKFKIDLIFMQSDADAENATFDNIEFATGQFQRVIFNITIDYNTITVVPKNNPAKEQMKPMNSAYFPDFIDDKYLSLSFFQPLQTDSSATIVNQCNLFLDYNGRYVWQPPAAAAATKGHP